MEIPSSPAPRDAPSAADIEQLRKEIRDNSSSLRTEIRREAQRVIFENDAREYLYGRLKPPVHIGARGTWACNFQILAFLTDEISRPQLRDPVIVELGSGVSTAWLGLCVKQKRNGKVYSFEHDPSYLRHTRWVVEQVGVIDDVEIVLAPMEDVDPAINHLTGNPQWYARDSLNRTVAGVDFLFVDGPPSTFGPGARAAAYPMFFTQLSDGALVILDDIHRSDEQHDVQIWKNYARSAGADLTHVATIGESAVFRHHLFTEHRGDNEREARQAS